MTEMGPALGRKTKQLATFVEHHHTRLVDFRLHRDAANWRNQDARRSRQFGDRNCCASRCGEHDFVIVTATERGGEALGIVGYRDTGC